jgi:tryptophan-rich sensory protein
MNTSVVQNKFKFHWFHGVIFFFLVNLIAGYGITLFVDIKEIYAVLNKPYFAPPVWLFGVAWFTNNVLTIIGNIWTLNLPSSIYRSRLLLLQGFSWFNYCIFQYLSFGTQIPSMFFCPTFSMLVLTLFSLYYAYRLDTSEMTFRNKVKSGKSITMSLASLVSWLLIATALGFQIWMLNK